MVKTKTVTKKRSTSSRTRTLSYKRHALKKPVSRQALARKASAARFARATTLNKKKAVTRRGTMTRSQAGRLGAEARWGIASTRKSATRRIGGTTVRATTSRTVAARRGATARFGKPTAKKHTKAVSVRRNSLSISRSEAGRRGAEARWGHTTYRTASKNGVRNTAANRQHRPSGVDSFWGFFDNEKTTSRSRAPARTTRRSATSVSRTRRNSRWA